MSETDKLLPDIIAPEGLEIAEAYLASGGDSREVSKLLGLPAEEVDKQLKKPEVKGYIDRIFNESGFRNRDRLFGVMDQLVNMKLDEVQETGVGTSLDIVDLLKAMHKMKVDEHKMRMDELKMSQSNSGPTNQTNIQNNFEMPGGGDPAYMNLLDKLAGGK